MLGQGTEKTFQTREMYDLLGVKSHEEADKVLSACFAFIAYLKPGDEILTESVRITKVDGTLFSVETKLRMKSVVDALAKKRVYRFPI